LADLELAQLLDHVGADKQSNQQGCTGGERRAKRQVAEYPERMKKRKQLLVEQPVKQVASNAAAEFSLILQAHGARPSELPTHVSPHEPPHEPHSAISPCDNKWVTHPIA
jgi:hypothetical protein